MGCHHITPLRPPHPATPPPIRIQVARTQDDIFAIVPRHLMAAPIDLQTAVQCRVLGTTDHVSWTRIEHRRLGLEGRSLSRPRFLSRLLPFPLFLSHTLFCLDDTLSQPLS